MDKTLKKEVISILVDNQSNVLTRVVSLFGRRGFNIDSLTVSATNNPQISRITIVNSSAIRMAEPLFARL